MAHLHDDHAGLIINVCRIANFMHPIEQCDG